MPTTTVFPHLWPLPSLSFYGWPLGEVITNSGFAASPDLPAARLFNYSFLASALRPYLRMEGKCVRNKEMNYELNQ